MQRFLQRLQNNQGKRKSCRGTNLDWNPASIKRPRQRNAAPPLPARRQCTGNKIVRGPEIVSKTDPGNSKGRVRLLHTAITKRADTGTVVACLPRGVACSSKLRPSRRPEVHAKPVNSAGIEPIRLLTTGCMTTDGPVGASMRIPSRVYWPHRPTDCGVSVGSITALHPSNPTRRHLTTALPLDERGKNG